MPSLEELAERARARLGRVLKAKWQLDSLLGVGGMAAVYAATHRNKKRVAVKMLHAHLSEERRLRARFLREGYLANSVGHESVVTVDDDEVDDDGSAFLVMELLKGETLDELRRRRGGTLPLTDVLPLMATLLDVLVVAHDTGIVHRDLKPENLFFVAPRSLKVLDFGLARVLEPDPTTGSLTQPDAVLGTPAFMAPEQAVGRWDLVDGRTDLWAAGATIFRLLSGRYVHEGETMQQQLAFAATAHALPLREVAPDVPADVAKVVDRSLAFARADRHEDARAMLAALVEAATANGIELPALPDRPRPVGPPSVVSLDDASIAKLRGGPPPGDLSLPATTRSTAHEGRTPGPSGGEAIMTPPPGESVGAPGRPRRANGPWLVAAGIAAGAVATLLLSRGRDTTTPDVTTTHAPVEATSSPRVGADTPSPVMPTEAPIVAPQLSATDTIRPRAGTSRASGAPGPAPVAPSAPTPPIPSIGASTSPPPATPSSTGPTTNPLDRRRLAG